MALIACNAEPSDPFAQASYPLCEEDVGPPPPLTDQMSPTRRLRRSLLALTGKTPTVEQYEAILALETDAQQAAIDAAAEEAIESLDFYRSMVTFGHDWIAVGRMSKGARRESYWGSQAANLYRCPQDSAHPGAWFQTNEAPWANDSDLCDQPDATPTEIEPWWAAGTTVQVLGQAALDTTRVGETDCGWSVGGYYDRVLASDGCGCGPNLVYCHPHSATALRTDHDPSLPLRQAWDEPARLFAHIVWQDRPLTDLILGNYTVAPLELRHLYVRMGRQNPAFRMLDDDDSWWRSTFAGPNDPLHPDDTDPLAWREIVIEKLNPYLLSLTEGQARSGSLDRTYHHDPRETTDPIAGIAAAGVLTTAAAQSSFSRERVRAARFLEMFACRTFIPPNADIPFNEYDRDPATTGTCQHCHRLMDPAAIHFKRWAFDGHYIQETPFIAGAEPWTWEYMQRGASRSLERWEKIFLPNTVMTPVTQAQIDANPDVILMDFLPPDQTLFGLQSDGTNGPLGFAKILVQSGQFDQCAARKIYAHIVGRELDPGRETGYIQALTRQFVAGGRRVKPYVRYLLQRPEFGRGL